MKKSEIYTEAIVAVIEDKRISTEDKREIIEQLFEDKNLAKWREEQESKGATLNV